MRRTLASMTVAAAAACLLAGAVLPAHAIEFNPDAPLDPSQVNDRRCERVLCLIEHTGFGGRRAYYEHGSKNLAKYGPAFNDRTSSIYNGTNQRWCVFVDADYEGRGWYVEPRRMYRSLNPAANDSISSLKAC